MSSRRFFHITFAFLLCLSLSFSTSASDKYKDKIAPTTADKPSYELPQPAKEDLDYTMYARIRDEGLAHSHVMDYASALVDGIGSRLNGSPNLHRANEWTRDQLSAMGCSNSHLEDWGEFGMGWQQLNTWVRMTAPDAGGRNTLAGAVGCAVVAFYKRRSKRTSYLGKCQGRKRFRQVQRKT